MNPPCVLVLQAGREKTESKKQLSFFRLPSYSLPLAWLFQVFCRCVFTWPAKRRVVQKGPHDGLESPSSVKQFAPNVTSGFYCPGKATRTLSRVSSSP